MRNFCAILPSCGGRQRRPDRDGECAGGHAYSIMAMAARHRLPAVYSSREYVASGGLCSYASDFLEQYRRAAWLRRSCPQRREAGGLIQCDFDFSTSLIDGFVSGFESLPGKRSVDTPFQSGTIGLFSFHQISLSWRLSTPKHFPTKLSRLNRVGIGPTLFGIGGFGPTVEGLGSAPTVANKCIFEAGLGRDSSGTVACVVGRSGCGLGSV